MESPTPRQIKAARLAAKPKLSQTAAGALVHVECRVWQRWEAGESAMHPAFWELFQLKVKEGK